MEQNREPRPPKHNLSTYNFAYISFLTRGRRNYSIRGLKLLNIYMENNEMDQTKINSRWIKDLGTKCKPLKLSKEKKREMEKYLSLFGASKQKHPEKMKTVNHKKADISY